MVTFENKRYSEEVNHIENGTLMFYGQKYNSLQFHFRTPSEHHIDGEYFPTKIHWYIDYRLYNQVKKAVRFNSWFTQSAPGEKNFLANAATYHCKKSLMIGV